MNANAHSLPAVSATAHPKAPWLQRLLPNLLLALASALVVPLALFGAESAARWLEPDYLLRVRGLHVHSDVYGWEPRRNVVLHEDGRVTTLGSHGQRGGGSLGDKSGHRRVVVLGDSVAFGIGVSDHETFAHRLDANDPGLEVVNLAVQGYGLGQAYLKLVREVMALEPDVVLLAFCADNDVVDTTRSTYLYDGTTPKPYYRLEANELRLYDAHVRAAGVRRLTRWLTDHSQLYVRGVGLWRPELTAKRALAAGTADGRHWGERRREAAAGREEGRALAFRLVAEMARESESHSARFVVALFPNRAAFDGVATLPEAFSATPLLAGVRRIDLTPVFRSSGVAFEELTLDPIGHLSPLGHSVVAAHLAPSL